MRSVRAVLPIDLVALLPRLVPGFGLLQVDPSAGQLAVLDAEDHDASLIHRCSGNLYSRIPKFRPDGSPVLNEIQDCRLKVRRRSKDGLPGLAYLVTTGEVTLRVYRRLRLVVRCEPFQHPLQVVVVLCPNAWR